MNLEKIPTGLDTPRDINVVIEIPQGSAVKYEIDKDSGAPFVDRFLFTPMAYPAAYGFVPGTLAEDGDAVDAMVMTPADVIPGCVVRARPIGVLRMEDESGPDEKLLCVPHDRVHPAYSHIETIDDLPAITRAAIEHFFKCYKDLEPNKWVRVSGWGGREEAFAVIERSVARAVEASGASKRV